MNLNSLCNSFVIKGANKSVHHAENSTKDFSKMVKIISLKKLYNDNPVAIFSYLVNVYTDTTHETFYLNAKMYLSKSGSKLIRQSQKCDKISFHYIQHDNGEIDIYLKLINTTSIVYMQELISKGSCINLEKENKFEDVSSLSLSEVVTDKPLEWGTLALENGISTHDNFCTIWKDYNTVHLRAYLKGNFTQGMSIGTLSSNHRPKVFQEFTVICRKDNDYLGVGVLSINESGVIKIQSFPRDTNILNITSVFLASKYMI